MRTSRRPSKALEICWAADSTLSRLVTSRWRARILGSGWPACLAASLVSLMTVVREDLGPRAIPEAPAWAKLMAAALPIPLEAPVMKIYPFCRLAFVGSMAG